MAVGRRVSVLEWRGGACGGDDGVDGGDGGSSPLEGLEWLRELQASEPPSLMSILETGERDGWALCCGLKHQFELHWASGGSRAIPVAECKPRLVGALDLADENEPELLLCYNNTCHFQKLSDERAAPTEFDFHWNSVPIAVACAFPYVIAFSSDSMEVRLIVNGNLVHSLAMPNLSLISCKRDVFFASSAPEVALTQPPGSPTLQQQQQQPGDSRPMRVYRIPLQTLSRAGGQQQQQQEQSSGAADCAANLLGLGGEQRSCSTSPSASLGLGSFDGSSSSGK